MPTYDPRRSQGPDRFHNSPRCREFHDAPGTDLGGNPNCCCCDPCHYVKPYEANTIAGAYAYRWCCRCIPRVIMLRFVPDDDTADCCQERGQMTALFPDAPAPIGDATNLWTEYTGLTMLNYQVTVRLGRLGGSLWAGGTGTGTGSYDAGICVWHIVAIYDPAGAATKVYDEYILIDQEYEEGVTGTGTGTGTFTASCIHVPRVIVADNVMGFQLGTSAEACYGKLILEDFHKARLPFLEIPEVKEFVDEHAFGQGAPITEGDHPRFVYLCGDCLSIVGLISCVAMDGDPYGYAGDLNGQPYYESGDWRLFWNESEWELSEVWIDTGTSEVLIPMAYGPTTADCPIGVYTRTANWTSASSTGPGTGSGTGTGRDKLPTYFCGTECGKTWKQPCGPCNRVCTHICVRGPRHLSVDTLPQTFQTFEWFEEWGDTGTANPSVVRGWSYVNPSDTDTGWEDIIYLEPDADYNVLVDGVEWARDYTAHAFGDQSSPYWYREISGQDAWLYWDGTQWVIMLGGNPVAKGPFTKSNPAGTYPPESGYDITYVVTVDTPTLSYNCRLRPRFESLSTNEVYPPATISTDLPDYYRHSEELQQSTARGCSNLLVEIRQTGDTYPYLRTLSVRCGFCSVWQHVCGLCRCVPESLCVIVYDGGDQSVTGTALSAGTLYTNLRLRWNKEILGWGDDSDPIRLLLIEDYKGDCAVDIDYPGYDVPTLEGHNYPNYPSYDCGNEAWYREMDDDVQFPAIVYNDFTNDRNFVVVALSHAPNCEPTPCTDATPCFDSCGGHPAVLYLDITVTPALGCCGGPIEDQIPCPPIHLPTVQLNFIDTGGYFTLGLGVTFTCGYVGFLPAVTTQDGTCCALWFYLVGGVLYIRGAATSAYSCLQNDDNHIELEETCEPYSASGGPAYYGPNLIPYCRCLYPDYYNNTLGPCDCAGEISVSIME